ncbi:MAG: hypothetical protein GF311_20785 [Candidatus Lokiarchaeota archaeon]|nr:hypothetical protein [Candidatus Lokiarchaeota archaeon]
MRHGQQWSRRVSRMRGGRSRNKVAVGEPAAGSPPIFYSFYSITEL